MRTDTDPALAIVHGALLSGIVIFGAVVMLVPLEGPSSLPGMVQWVWLVFVVLAVFGAGVVRGRLGAKRDPASRRQGAIVLWALAEGAALVSLVFAWITGSSTPLIGALVGVLLLLYHRPSTLDDGGRPAAGA
ncbi:MAG: hypothetical protein R3266_04285 [Gemmatimonadota bacterium]|nr:hypothetical protein [Gemmatimonadota bacterium]